MHNKISHLFLLITEGQRAEINERHGRCTLWTCENPQTCRWVHARAHTDLPCRPHPHPHSTPSPPFCTSYNSMSGFETWSAGCLVTAAWFSGYWSYPFPPTPLSFYSVSQWTSFFPLLQSQGFKQQEDACRTETHTLPIPDRGKTV